MVRTAGFLVTLPLSFVAATQNHVTSRFPWDRTANSDPATTTSPKTIVDEPRHKLPKLFGEHRAYLQHELASPAPTTLLTVTTTEPPTPSFDTNPMINLQDVQRRQLGGLLGLGGGGLGGIVSNLLGGIQPALTSALAPIQSAANTNLAQISLVKSMAPQVVPTADVIGPAATAASPVLAGLLGNIISAVAPIVSNIQGVVSQIAAPVQSLAAPIESAVQGPIQDAVAPLVSALAPAVAAALAPAGEAAGGLIQPVASNLLGPIESAVAPLLGAVVSNAVGAAGGLENPLADALRPILDAVDDAVLPLASAAVSAVWPAIAPVVTPLNPVICALQPAEVPLGGNATALIPVQCVSVTGGNMIPVSTDVATVISPTGLTSITPAADASPLTSNGVPDRAALPMPGIPGLPVPTPTTTITAPVPITPLASALGGTSNPLASKSSSAASAEASSQLSTATGLLASILAGAASNSVPTATGSAATNPLGSAAAAASSFLAGLGSSNSLTIPQSLPSTSSTLSTSIKSSTASSSSTIANVVPSVASPTSFSATSSTTTISGPSVMTFAGALTGVLTALPVVVPASAVPGNMGTTAASGSANLPNIPFPAPSPPPPASPLPVSTTPLSIPPAGGTVPSSSSYQSVTPAPVAQFGQGNLIMLAYGSQTITFAASQLPGGGLVASMSGNIYAFPASTPAALAAPRKRDLTPQPDYEALALALVSLLSQGHQNFTSVNSTSTFTTTSELSPLASDISDLAASSAVPALTTDAPVLSSASVNGDDFISTSSDDSSDSDSPAPTDSSTTFAANIPDVSPEAAQLAAVATNIGSANGVTSSSMISSMNAAASGASLSVASCPDINGTSYLSNGGSVYQIFCGINWIGRDIQPWRSAVDFDHCVAECDALNAAARNRPCAAALFVPDAPSTAANCYPKYSADDPTNTTGGYTFQAAVLQSSGNVVDNGVGLILGESGKLVAPDNKDEAKDLSNDSAANTVISDDDSITSSLSDNDGTTSPTSASSTPTPSSNTLALTSNNIFGALNATGDGSSDSFPIVYASGTIVLQPLISTTLMLGAASNQPATQYFAVNVPETAIGLAGREAVIPTSSAFPHVPRGRDWLPMASPDPWLPMATVEQKQVPDPWLPLATVEQKQVADPWLPLATIEQEQVADPWLPLATVEQKQVADPWLPLPTVEQKQVPDPWLPLATIDQKQVPDPWLPGPSPISSPSGSYSMDRCAARQNRSLPVPAECVAPSSTGSAAATVGQKVRRAVREAQDPLVGTEISHNSLGQIQVATSASGGSFVESRNQFIDGQRFESSDRSAEPRRSPTVSPCGDLKWLPTHPALAPTPSETPHLWKREAPAGWLPTAPAGPHAAEEAGWLPSAELTASVVNPADSPSTDPAVSKKVDRAGWLPSAPGPNGARSDARDDAGWLTTDSELPSVVQDMARTSLNGIRRVENAGWLPTAQTVPTQVHSSSAALFASANGILERSASGTMTQANVERQVDMSINPNAYNPIGNQTGANFALADNPVDPTTGILPGNDTNKGLLSDLTNIPHFSRDGGKGGMIGDQHVFVFADTGVYTTQSDGSNGHYIGYSSSSVATDLGQHGLFGNSLILHDGVGEYADSQGNLRGFAPLSLGETGFNEQAIAAGVSSRYAIWPESSFIQLTADASIMYAPLVYDVVDSVTKSADFTYMGNTLLYITADDVSGPVAERLVGRLFNASDVEWGCVGGIRSWGESGVGGEDGMVYLFGNVRGGLLMSRTNVTNIADTSMYEYWSGNSWTTGSLAPDSTAYVLEGSFMDVDVFYSPRHLTFLAVYTNIYGDNTVYWRYLDAPQAILPSYAGGDPDADFVEAITKYQWSEEHTLLQLGAGLNGDYSYSMGVHLGYFGQNDISSGGEKMLLSWTSPTGQDAASRNSAFQIKNGVVTWA